MSFNTGPGAGGAGGQQSAMYIAKLPFKLTVECLKIS